MCERVFFLLYKCSDNKVREPQIIAGSLPQSPEKCVISSCISLSLSLRRQQCTLGECHNKSDKARTFVEWLCVSNVWKKWNFISLLAMNWPKVDLFGRMPCGNSWSEEMRRHARPLCSRAANLHPWKWAQNKHTRPKKLAAADFKLERLILLIGSCNL